MPETATYPLNAWYAAGWRSDFSQSLTARTICELAIKLRDLEDVSSIFVTHEMKNVEYLSSEYATVNDDGEVVFELEGEKLCLINTEIIMLRQGNIIFSGKDEELRATQDPYILKFMRGK